MRAGELDQVVAIEKRTDTLNAANQPIPTWQPWASVPAAIDLARGREFFSAQQLMVVRAALFRVRYVPGIGPSMRIKWDGDVWDIASVEQTNGRNRELDIYAATGLTDG